MARRKKEPANAHRRTIRKAADILFRDKGMAAATVDQIAKAAGYSKATLYVYFENKEEIFFSLVYDRTQILYEELKKIVDGKPIGSEDWLDNYLQICFTLQQLCQDYPIYFDGMIGHISVDIHLEETAQIYKDIYQLGIKMNQLIRHFVEDGVRLAILQPDLDCDRATLFFWSALSGIIRMAANKKDYYHLLGLDNDAFLKEEYLTLLNCYKNKGRLVI